jgi:hypothetical protein
MSCGKGQLKIIRQPRPDTSPWTGVKDLPTATCRAMFCHKLAFGLQQETVKSRMTPENPGYACGGWMKKAAPYRFITGHRIV